MSSSGCRKCLNKKSIDKNEEKQDTRPKTESGTIAVAIPDEPTMLIIRAIQNMLCIFFASIGVEFYPVAIPHLTISAHLIPLDIPTTEEMAKMIQLVFSEFGWDFMFKIPFDCIKVNLSGANHNPYLCLSFGQPGSEQSSKFDDMSRVIHYHLMKRKIVKHRSFSPIFHFTLGTFPGESAKKIHDISAHPQTLDQYVDPQNIRFMIQRTYNEITIKESMLKSAADYTLTLYFKYVSLMGIHRVDKRDFNNVHSDDEVKCVYISKEKTAKIYPGDLIEIVGKDYFPDNGKPRIRQYISRLHDNKDEGECDGKCDNKDNGECDSGKDTKPKWRGNFIVSRKVGESMVQYHLGELSASRLTTFRWRGDIPNEPIDLDVNDHICMAKDGIIICLKCYSDNNFIDDKNGWVSQTGGHCVIHSLRKWKIDQNQK